MTTAHGLPPISRADATTLVLGTMPGKASLQAGQYYAHGQNSFWKLAATILGFDPSSSYEKRVSSVVAARVAVWDVLRLCTREGSLDSDIEDPVPNEFIDFFKTHREVDRVCFNGSKAEQLYKTYVLAVITKPLDYRPLPSTSQANASVTFASKLSQWSVGLSRD